ncbi:MAG TPA: ABC transporter ATP-binding protein [Polyangiaceae bacterium]|nr:ABC transporter ATP-binding protein [Polyangiaceae bacterium]
MVSPSIAWSASEWLSLSLLGYVPFRGSSANAAKIQGRRYTEYSLMPFDWRVLFEARCLDSPTQGEFVFDGQSIAEHDFDALAALRNEKIGFIFQSFNLVPVLDVLENIEFPCLMSRKREPAEPLRKRARELAEEVGLGACLKHRPDELSGGQRQRVAIARALITQPKLVLADEPTANLDSHTSEQTIALMQRLNEEKNVTFLFSTHEARVRAQARRVVLIADGVISAG